MNATLSSRFAALALTAAVLVPACSSVTGESFTSRTYDLAAVKRMAVVDGNNPTWKPEIRQTLVDSVQFEFLALQAFVWVAKCVEKAVPG